MYLKELLVYVSGHMVHKGVDVVTSTSEGQGLSYKGAESLYVEVNGINSNQNAITLGR